MSESCPCAHAACLRIRFLRDPGGDMFRHPAKGQVSDIAVVLLCEVREEAARRAIDLEDVFFPVRRTGAGNDGLGLGLGLGLG